MKKGRIDFIENIITYLGSIKAVKMLNLPDVLVKLVYGPRQLNTLYKNIQFTICCNSNVIAIDH